MLLKQFSLHSVFYNQRDPPEYDKARLTENETLWNVNETAQAVLTRLYRFPQPFIEFSMINITVCIRGPLLITRV